MLASAADDKKPSFEPGYSDAGDWAEGVVDNGSNAKSESIFHSKRRRARVSK